jgi:hypothetical protein
VPTVTERVRATDIEVACRCCGAWLVCPMPVAVRWTRAHRAPWLIALHHISAAQQVRMPVEPVPL